jgi:nicotinic acid mononucleotide adenylyltransferase
MRTLVFAYGRLNPPTLGHVRLTNTIVRTAYENAGDGVLILSHSHDHKRNPLTISEKLHYAKLAFPQVRIVAATAECPSFLKYLGTQTAKYDRVIMVAGSDRVEHLRSVLNQYNGKEYQFKDINVISAGERDDCADDVRGISGTKMRLFAAENKLGDFIAGLPGGLQIYKGAELFHAVRRGMRME